MQARQRYLTDLNVSLRYQLHHRGSTLWYSSWCLLLLRQTFALLLETIAVYKGPRCPVPLHSINSILNYIKTVLQLNYTSYLSPPLQIVLSNALTLNSSSFAFNSYRHGPYQDSRHWRYRLYVSSRLPRWINSILSRPSVQYGYSDIVAARY